MPDLDPKFSDCRAPASDGEFDRIADAALAAIISAGAEALRREPWRVERIIRGAPALSIDELAARTARRTRAGAPSDVNLAIALSQLALALKSPRFGAAWIDWRRGAATARSSNSDSALCE